MKTIKLDNKEFEIIKEIHFKPINTFEELENMSNNYYTDTIYVVKDIPVAILFNVNPKNVPMNADFKNYYMNISVGYSILYDAQNSYDITDNCSRHLFCKKMLTKSLQNRLLKALKAVDENRADALKNNFKSNTK